MANLKINVKWSFWAFLALALVFRQGYFAGMYAVAMVLHECAHYVVASKLFYHCKKIQIDLFGAVLYGDFQDVTPRDRIKIALAGPCCNVTLCAICLAVWWVFPDSYVFTEVFFQANVSMAVVNLLPFYPLDGGRVITGVLENKLGDKALLVVKKVTVASSLLLFALFVTSLFTGHNLFSLGLFAIGLFCGIITKSGGEIYAKSVFVFSRQFFLKNGMEKKTLVFNSQNTLADVAKRMVGNHLYCLEVVNDDMEIVARYSIAQLEKLVVTCPIDTKLNDLGRHL